MAWRALRLECRTHWSEKATARRMLHHAKRQRPPRLTGHTLLELVMATAIVAATLVPALRVFRDSMAVGREIDQRNLMSMYCTSKMEEHLAIVTADWTTGTVIGDFAADGHDALRYIVQRSDDPADGGIEDRLMSVVATVYEDQDGSDTMDAGEPRLVFRSKSAYLEDYQSEAE